MGCRYRCLIMADFRSASTQVLTNPGLLHCIFTFVPTPLFSGSRTIKVGQLTRCTTVCPTFHEPAIRLLWRKLDTFLPLWQLLAPPDANFPRFSVRGDTRLDHLYKVSTQVATIWNLPHSEFQIVSGRLHDDPAVWDRFLWHAARVREISYDAYHDTQELAMVQRLLAQTVIMQNGGKTTLPLLRSIHWLERTPMDGSLIPFFTATLREADFSFSGPSDEVAHALLLRRLCECAPYLEKITIGTTYLDELNLRVGPRIVQELLSFDRVHKINIYRFTGHEAFRDLVAKPNLTSLAICTVAGSWTGPSSPIRVHNLRELSVSGTGPELSAFFALAYFDALESVSFDVHAFIEPVDETIAALTTFCNAVPASLRSLDLFFFGT